MVKASPTPGLIRRQRKGGVALYWSAESISRDGAKTYPDKLVALPADADEHRLAALCQSYTARFREHMSGRTRERYPYTGTIASLCDAFAHHPDSPMQGVKANTARSYAGSLKIIRKNVGNRAVRQVVPIDTMGWYRRWRAPEKPGGPERIKRAHDAIAIVRAVLRFGGALGHRECMDLAVGMANLQFERSGRRDAEMTREQVEAFITQAIALNYMNMAIGVATQFETGLRQKDVIGEHRPQGWHGLYTWENIPGGLFRIKTSKTATPAVFDLKRYDSLWALLQQVPQAERAGAIVKGHDGAAIREGRYRKLFRRIANKAGIPLHVWNMDSRAGAITEAWESGADPAHVSRAAQHSQLATTKIYDRGIASSIEVVADARKRLQNRE